MGNWRNSVGDHLASKFENDRIVQRDGNYGEAAGIVKNAIRNEEVGVRSRLAPTNQPLRSTASAQRASRTRLPRRSSRSVGGPFILKSTSPRPSARARYRRSPGRAVDNRCSAGHRARRRGWRCRRVGCDAAFISLEPKPRCSGGDHPRTALLDPIDTKLTPAGRSPSIGCQRISTHPPATDNARISPHWWWSWNAMASVSTTRGRVRCPRRATRSVPRRFRHKARGLPDSRLRRSALSQ